MREPFEQVVRRQGPTVLRVVSAILGPGPDADDAWQETFLAALRVWPDLPDDLNAQAWLVRVAQRKALDVVRARARRPVPVAATPDEPSTLGIPGGFDLDLWDAIAALPNRQRLAVTHHFLGGLTHAETAALIGGTPESVRRASADGIKALGRDRHLLIEEDEK